MEASEKAWETKNVTLYRVQAELTAATAQLETRQQQLVAAERAVAVAEARIKRREDEVAVAEEKLRLAVLESDRVRAKRDQTDKVRYLALSLPANIVTYRGQPVGFSRSGKTQ